mmetsp:Transcript_51805/g.155465  ORF Transcript_51805/g.155465 Transcript_51805/m.155465 type:complete len:116 (+) Transcript_51805:795-1142(+)
MLAVRAYDTGKLSMRLYMVYTRRGGSKAIISSLRHFKHKTRHIARKHIGMSSREGWVMFVRALSSLEYILTANKARRMRERERDINCFQYREQGNVRGTSFILGRATLNKRELIF